MIDGHMFMSRPDLGKGEALTLKIARGYIFPRVSPCSSPHAHGSVSGQIDPMLV